ncbi:hypothetical protein MTP99_016381 [Tenebrio molitor]|nr:hypothetical protein MTP99_016381 [Tenebrio molitor]
MITLGVCDASAPCVKPHQLSVITTKMRRPDASKERSKTFKIDKTHLIYAKQTDLGSTKWSASVVPTRSSTVRSPTLIVQIQNSSACVLRNLPVDTPN